MSQGIPQVISEANQLAQDGQLPADLGPLLESGDPSVQIQARFVDMISAGDEQFKADLYTNIQRLKNSLMGPTPTPVEEWYTDDVVTLWLSKSYLNIMYLRALGGDLGAIIQTIGGEDKLGTWVKIQDIPQARMNQGVRILSNIREQSANMIGPQGVATPGAAIVDEQQKIQEADAGIAPAVVANEPGGAALITPGAPSEGQDGQGQEGPQQGQAASIPQDQGQSQG